MTKRKVNVNARGDLENSVTKAWQDRAEFTTSTGSLHSEIRPADRTFVNPYRLTNPDDLWALTKAQDTVRANEGYTLYIVFSYITPIAWSVISPDGVIISTHHVSQKFSVTTSKHCGRLWDMPKGAN